MNQTKKRLAIIKLAISMTDTETIQLQVLKLGMLKTDSKMREILTLLNEKSYARAQGLISEYIETPSNTILQRTSQEPIAVSKEQTVPQTAETAKLSPEESMLEPIKNTATKEETPLTLQEKIQAAKDQAIIDEFELFIENPETEQTESVTEEEVNYTTLLDTTPPPKKMSTQTVDYDALLNVNAADVLSDNISLDITQEKKDTFFDEQTPVAYNTPGKDAFFDAAITNKTQEEQTPSSLEDMTLQEKIAQDNFMKETFGEKPVKEPSVKKSFVEKTPMPQAQDDIPMTKEDTSSQPTPIEKSFTAPADYPAISYIDQKFKNISNQYPAVEESNASFDSVDAWLLKISNKGYSEAEVEEIIKQTEKLTNSNNKAEAAQLLLICGATQSKYAQFRLARALFSGELLQKNLAESFTLINRLALNDDYPEAICDLAQFYEKGIGVSTDKKKAETLYKEAMDLGIQRAAKHYERLSKENKGFFSFRK